MTHRDECTLCEQYAEHAVAALEKPMVEKLTVEIPSHQIELAFQMVWSCMVAHIEDDAMDEAHGKLSWYRDRYQNAIKDTKLLQQQLDSKKECRCKAESKLHYLWEDKNKGKQREVSASCEWHEWESTLDSDIAEKTLSKASRKRWHCDTGAPDVPPGGMTTFPDAEPMELGPHMMLPPVESEQQMPETMVPAATMVPPSTLAPLL